MSAQKEKSGGGGSSACQGLSLLFIVAILVLQVVVVLILYGIVPTKEVSEPNGSQLSGGGGGHREPIITDDKHNERDISTKITKSFYSRTADGEDVYKYTFENKNGQKLEIITFGATITKITSPCRHGHQRDIILGYDTPEKNLNKHEYFGSIIGRYANRIKDGRFTVDGQPYQLHKNDGQNHLHGGQEGWDKKVWESTQEEDHVSLTYISPDGDEGYPGKVKVTVTYQLTEDNEVIINFTARVYKKATPINLTAHPFFNLGGESSNRTIYDHNVTIYADKYVEVDDHLIPTGNTPNVEGTLFDLTSPVNLGDRLNNISTGSGFGYDHSFVLRGPTGKKLAARVYHPRSGRTMEVYTNQPGLQFYTGNFLNVECGKLCHYYGQHMGFTMETQNHPDAMNQPLFPDSILRPGSTYLHQVWYKFTTD